MESAGRVKGSAFRALLEWYARRFGPGSVAQLLAELEPELRALLAEDRESLGILPATWYPAELLHAFCDAIVRRLTATQAATLAKSAARASTDASLKGVYRAAFRALASPDLYARYAQQLWRLHYDNGTYAVQVVSPTEHRITITGWASHHPLICEALVGSGTAIYELLGCRGPTVTRLECVSSGARSCTFESRWHAA